MYQNHPGNPEQNKYVSSDKLANSRLNLEHLDHFLRQNSHRLLKLQKKINTEIITIEITALINYKEDLTKWV